MRCREVKFLLTGEFVRRRRSTRANHPHQSPGERVNQLVRVQNFNVSSDGIGAGADQSFESPFGLDPEDIFAWAGATASWPNRTDPGGSRGLDDYFTRDFDHNIGAEIMGRNKFGPQRGPWTDHEWRGWWGDEPPFHTPVFVMTHHTRPSFTLGDTTFHFVDGDPATTLDQARQAAQGKDVRLGGGVTTIRQFLDADLVDAMHIAVSPVTFGAGLRLWESPEELLDRFHLEIIPSPSGVSHHVFWRK
jgi:dihydrofolate reductase